MHPGSAFASLFRVTQCTQLFEGRGVEFRSLFTDGQGRAKLRQAQLLLNRCELRDHLGERLGPFPTGTPALSALQLIATRGRLFRFEVAESTGGNTGAIEVRLYGAAE